MHPRVMPLAALLSCALFSAGCVQLTEPENLYVRKQALIEYHDNGQYDAAVAKVAAEASAFIRQRAGTDGARLALVLDIDDTALSTWGRILADDFARKDEFFVRWATMTTNAPAIVPILDLYREARSLGVKIYFVTGRRPNLTTQTEANLRAIGFDQFERVFYRPEVDPNRSASVFKAESRRAIEATGLKVIANIGDQQSDLDGGVAERTFKLPNPFYYSP